MPYSCYNVCGKREVAGIDARTWKDLKAKQKQKLSEIMFGVVCDYYREHGQMPDNTDLEKLAARASTKIQGRGLGLSKEEIHDVFLWKQARFAERIEKNGLPEPPKPKVKKTEAEKLAIKRVARKRRKAKKAAQEQQILPEQDDRFFFIAGYTSGGAPYGVTWEAMGLEPWEELE